MDSEIKLYAMAENGNYQSEIESASIVHDITKPFFKSFSAGPSGTLGKWIVNYESEDPGNYPSGIAGIIVQDIATDPRIEFERWYYFPDTAEVVLEPPAESGKHIVTAWLVDNADVDQTVIVPNTANLTEDNIISALTGGWDVMHRSDEATDEIFVLSNEKVYNFPNPFYPHHEQPEYRETKISIPFSDASSVEIRIFDLFGNLVWESGTVQNINGGSFTVPWTGNSGTPDEIGPYVASGTYLAIIDFDNGIPSETIKIGVLRTSGK
jgi:hypothetical protein